MRLGSNALSLQKQYKEKLWEEGGNITNKERNITDNKYELL